MFVRLQPWRMMTVESGSRHEAPASVTNAHDEYNYFWGPLSRHNNKAVYLCKVYLLIVNQGANTKLPSWISNLFLYRVNVARQLQTFMMDLHTGWILHAGGDRLLLVVLWLREYSSASDIYCSLTLMDDAPPPSRHNTVLKLNYATLCIMSQLPRIYLNNPQRLQPG